MGSNPYRGSTRANLSSTTAGNHDSFVYLCIPAGLHQLFKELHDLVTTDTEHSELRDLAKIFAVKL